MTFEQWARPYNFDTDTRLLAEAAWTAGASNLLAEILEERERNASNIADAEQERLRRLKLQM